MTPRLARLASAGGDVEVFLGTSEGAGAVPGGACSGTELEIENPVSFGFMTIGGNGFGQLSLDLLAEDCQPFVQAVDQTSCVTSAVRGLGAATASSSR